TFGAPGNVYYGNGVSTTYTHDQMQHLTRVTTTQAGAPIQDLIFDWYYSIYPNVQTNGLALGNVLDNRSNKNFARANTHHTQIYFYGSFYRLTAATGGWGSRSYIYDGGSAGVGNPTSFGGYTQRTLNYSGQHVTSGTDGAGWNLSNVFYDNRGNMTHKTFNGD